MAVIDCPGQNEMVYFDMKNPALVLNIFEQEDGILIAVHSGSENTPNIEALLNDAANTAPLNVFNRIAAGEIITVDSIFVGQKDEEDEDTDEYGEGEDAEEEKGDW